MSLCKIGDKVFKSVELKTVSYNQWKPQPITADEADMARASLMVYERLAEPAGAKKASEVIARVLVNGYIPNNEKDRALLMNNWRSHLEMFPAWALEEVVWEWQRNNPNNGRPQIGDIVKQAEARSYMVKAPLERLRQLVEAWDNNKFYEHKFDVRAKEMSVQPIDREGNPID